MNCINGDTFEIRREEETATIVFKGALRLTGTEDYAPILEMLKSTLDTGAPLITVDLKDLEFLNSSGITMLSRFVIEARNHQGINVQFLASSAITWHARSLTNLQRLMPSLIVQMV